jgi:hypothetical protein
MNENSNNHKINKLFTDTNHPENNEYKINLYAIRRKDWKAGSSITNDIS